MSETKRGRCRSCNQVVIWCKTVTGKNMPLDPHTSIEGNIDLVDGVGHVVAKSKIGDELRHRSHFVSCKEADAWRRKN
jgi:hypothetical protein